MINQAFNICNSLQEKINLTINEINEAIITLNQSAEKSKEEIIRFYSEIRKIIDERESNLKIKIKEQLSKEENSLKFKQKNLFEQISIIKEFVMPLKLILIKNGSKHILML